MKINKLKQIIENELKILKEQGAGPRPTGPTSTMGITGGVPTGGVTPMGTSPGQTMGMGGPSTGGVNPGPGIAGVSQACMSAIVNAGRMASKAKTSRMNENQMLSENIVKRFRGAIKKVFTNCGDLYDESGGPVGT
tara:strand:+ start:4830 stop:5237 length:408 start_codon:yes stop_codon:yes gene_type:complete